MRRLVGGWLGAIVSVLFLLSPPSEAAEPPPLSVPILLYHRLGPTLTDDMTVTTPVVESQLKLIQERGYHVIPLKTLLASCDDPSVAVPERAVVLVADDGHRTVYTDLFPLIKRFQIPVTLFIYPSAISNANYAMTWEQLAEMKASGLVDIQSHTFWHPNFKIEKKRLTPAAYEKFTQDQLVKSKAVLEAEAGRQGRPAGLALRHLRRRTDGLGPGGGLCRGVLDRPSPRHPIRECHGAAALHRHRRRPRRPLRGAADAAAKLATSK